MHSSAKAYQELYTDDSWYYPYYDYYYYYNHYDYYAYTSCETRVDARMEYIMKFGGYWLYVGDDTPDLNDWYPVKPLPMYLESLEDAHPEDWRWIIVLPDYVEVRPDGSTVYTFGSAVNAGGIGSDAVKIYDAVSLADLGSYDGDGDGVEYDGIGARSDADLGIDVELLGGRKDDGDWWWGEEMRSGADIAKLAMLVHLVFPTALLLMVEL